MNLAFSKLPQNMLMFIFAKFGHALDVIAKLLQGEKDLETYLLENPPSEVNVQTAKEKLVAAERNLRYVFNRCPKEKVVYIVRYWAVS